MKASWAKRIRAAQRQPTVEIGGSTFVRIKYGDDFPDAAKHCRDFAVEHGQYHVATCCIERYPRCSGQAISCGCDDFDGDSARVLH